MTLAEFALIEVCVAAWAATALPPARPASAADRSTALSWFFIVFLTSLGIGADILRGLGKAGWAVLPPRRIRWYAAFECRRGKRLQGKPRGMMNLPPWGVTWLVQ